MTSALFNFLASLVLIASILLALHFGRHGTPNTLVIYVFSDTDKEYIYNLRYFVREGIKEGDGCDYVIVIQREASPMFDIPSHIRSLTSITCHYV